MSSFELGSVVSGFPHGLPDCIVVSTLCCGRSNLSSNLSHSTFILLPGDILLQAHLPLVSLGNSKHPLFQRERKKWFLLTWKQGLMGVLEGQWTKQVGNAHLRDTDFEELGFTDDGTWRSTQQRFLDVKLPAFLTTPWWDIHGYHRVHRGWGLKHRTCWVNDWAATQSQFTAH